MAWPLVGRGEELRAIGALLERGAGGVVLAGAPGVGKTRLAGAAAELAEQRGCAVEWARATRAAASIPLGAFAAVVSSGAGVELLASIRRELAARAGGRPLVLCVDDAQLLDEASAALVHQLVAAGEAFAVVTVARDAPVPDAVRALWKDDLCERAELGELSRGELDALVDSALGGPLDGRSLDALWHRTLGNPLFVREIVRHGLASGTFARTGGVWRWSGEAGPGARLAELVELRLEGLSARERELLELVAVGAPLGIGLAGAAATAAPAAALEAAELLVRRGDERRRSLDVVHPLHAEVVRGRIPPSRLEALYARLAGALEACGARRRGDALRLAVWRLEAGDHRDGALLERGSGLALAAFDAALAERLARAAGEGFGARLARARALAAAGRAEQAHELLAALEAVAADDAQRVAVALATARNMVSGLDRADDADAVLRRAERAVSAAPLRHDLAAQRARLDAASGRPREALAAALPLLRGAGVREAAQVHAALATTEAMLALGRTDAVLAVAGHWLPAARRHGDAFPQAAAVLESMHGVAQWLGGRLADATANAERTYADAIALRSAHTSAVEAAMSGLVWLARGRVRTALRFGREGAALLRDADASGMRALALAVVVQAAAQAGDAAAAADAAAELDRTPLGHRAFAAEVGLARAWAAASGGELTSARALARGAAEAASSRGQDAFAARVLHELCRLGGAAEAATPLAELAPRLEGPFGALAAGHAAALAARDGAALLEVAEAFAELDALLVAAEAAGAAAAAFRDAGREPSARAAAARAEALLAGCEGARLRSAPAAEELTPREREIALLAASGLTSREIAARLVLSVRTVDNHLQRVFRKVGVSSRSELRPLIE